MTLHLRATGRHLPYGITQCYLSPDTSERAPPNSRQTGWYSIYLPRRDGRLSWPSWLDILYRKYLLQMVLVRFFCWGAEWISRWRRWRHFSQRSATTWWVYTKRLPAPTHQPLVTV